MHCGTRLSLLLLAALATAAWADSEVIALRQHNTARLSLRGQDRALLVRDRSVTGDPQRAADLLLFCRQKGVTAIFVATWDLPPSHDFDGTTAYRWRHFIGRAHQQGADVFALTGDSSWLRDVGRAYRQLDALAQVGAQGAPGEGFDGVLFDFPALSQLHRLLPPTDQLAPPSEEQLTDGASRTRELGPRAERPTRTWDQPIDGEAPRADPSDLVPVRPTYDEDLLVTADLADQELLRQHLDVLDRLRRYLARRYPTQRLRLGVSLPAWLRIPLGWHNEVKYAGDHFADATDFLVAHNYPVETSDIHRAADSLLQYAGRSGKRVFLRVELSFPVRPVPELISLFGQDELFLETLVSEVLERHESTPGFAGVALDDYLSYLRLPVRRDLEPASDARAGLPGGLAR